MKLSDSDKWIYLYSLSSCLSSMAGGAKGTVAGPTQLYLANKVGVSIAQINLGYSFGAVGVLLGASLAGILFKTHVKSGRAKTGVIFAIQVVSSCLQGATPFARSFSVLMLITALQAVTVGAFITVDAAMLVYIMGPVRSRPFTNVLHTSVGVGFWLGTLIVRPFLPVVETEASKEQHMREACQQQQTGGDGEQVVHGQRVFEQEAWLGLEKVFWPYVVTGVLAAAAAAGYLCLAACAPWRMPVFEEECGPEEMPDRRRCSCWPALLAGVLVFYFLSCGVERIFQPIAYTLGLCGPLALKPSEAVVTDNSYSGGFMLGRFVSIAIARTVRPRNLVLLSLGSCVLSSVALCLVGGVDKYGLYISTGVLGFFLAWQFGCCYSWVARRIDVTGWISCVFFWGCGVGGAVFAPASAYFFQNVGPQSVLYLTLAASAAISVDFAAMLLFGNRKDVAVGVIFGGGGGGRREDFEMKP